MENFQSLDLPATLQKSLAKQKLEKPTDVQIQAIPQILDGRDIIVSAPTGTGKTLSFAIPILAKLLSNQDHGAIIITPTRELAVQIMSVFQSLLIYNKQVKSALLIGGAHISKQITQLQAKPQLIIGTPGRINDHIDRKTLNLKKVKFAVLDEMDRMMDMGFSVQIDDIFDYLPKKLQVLMLSATIAPQIVKSAGKYLNDPVKVTIDANEIVNTDIKQEFIQTTKDNKYEDLIFELNKREGTIVVFVKTRRNTEELSKKLVRDGFKARALNGGLRQHQRDKVVRLFRKEEFKIIVATDVAARGIDIPHIKHVINYNLPTDPEDYVHRVGRTGRAGQEGYAVCFISPNERKEWLALEYFLNPDKVKPKQKIGKSKAPKRSKDNNRRGGSFGRRDDRERRDSRSGGSFSGRRDDRERRDNRSGGSFSGRRDDRERRDNRSGGSFSGRRDDRDRRDNRSGGFSGRRDDRDHRDNRSGGSSSGRRDDRDIRGRDFSDRRDSRDGSSSDKRNRRENKDNRKSNFSDRNRSRNNRRDDFNSEDSRERKTSFGTRNKLRDDSRRSKSAAKGKFAKKNNDTSINKKSFKAKKIDNKKSDGSAAVKDGSSFLKRKSE